MPNSRKGFNVCLKKYMYLVVGELFVLTLILKENNSNISVYDITIMIGKFNNDMKVKDYKYISTEEDIPNE